MTTANPSQSSSQFAEGPNWRIHYTVCGSGPALIADYNGTPSPFGVGLQTHLLALGGGGTSETYRWPRELRRSRRTAIQLVLPLPVRVAPATGRMALVGYAPAVRISANLVARPGTGAARAQSGSWCR